MANQLTPSGLEINTFQENLENYINQLNSIYGSDVDANQDTPDGQYAGIDAKIITDLCELLVLLKACQDPDQASGTCLDEQMRIIGINRQLANNSTWDLVVNCNNSDILPANYTVIDETNNSWRLLNAVNVVAGNNTITFTAVESGAIIGNAGENITQSTIRLSVASITAIVDAVVGRSEEKDPDARIRREKSVSYPANGTIAGLLSKVLNLSDVTDANIFENNTSVSQSPDGVNTVPAHTIWLVVQGGSTQDIANAMVKGSNTAGCGFKGAVEFDFQETVSLNGNSYVTTKTVRFDRTLEIPLYIKCDFKKKDIAEDVNIDLIKTNLEKVNYQTGAEVVASELYSVIYNSVNNAVFTNLQISSNNNNFVDSSILPQFLQKFVINGNNVVFSEVT